MKLFLLVVLLLLPAISEAAQFECRCTGNFCASGTEPVVVNYEPKIQFLEIEGPKWKYSGHVTRQESKVTGAVYITVPGSYSFGPTTIEVKESRDRINIERNFNVGGMEYACGPQR